MTYQEPIKNIPQELFILRLADLYKAEYVYNVGAYPTKTGRHLTEGLLGKSISVVAFEPSIEGFSKYNNLYSDHENIKIFNFALGDKKEQRKLKIVSGKEFMGTLVKTNEKWNPYIDDEEKIKTEKVCVEKLDDFVKKNQLEPPDIIKIDVMGWEHNFVLGAKETIKKNKPLLFFKFNVDGKNVFLKTKDTLSGLGYTYIDIYNMGALFSRVNPYYVFYLEDKHRGIIEIIKEFSNKDFSQFYKDLLCQNQ